MSVYSYVELKVHTNVRKVGTHWNVCFIYRTYVRLKYTCLFSYKKYCSLYNEHFFAPPFFFSLSLLYYYILYTEKRTLFPAHFFIPPLSYPFFVYSFIIYSIYREEYTFPQLFTIFPPFPIVLLYSSYI